MNGVTSKQLKAKEVEAGDVLHKETAPSPGGKIRVKGGESERLDHEFEVELTNDQGGSKTRQHEMIYGADKITEVDSSNHAASSCGTNARAPTSAVIPGAYAEGGRPPFARPRQERSDSADTSNDDNARNQVADPNDGLVEARPVLHDPEQACPEEASPVSDVENDAKRSNKCSSMCNGWLGLLMVLVVVGAALLTAFLSDRGGEERLTSSLAPTPTPTQAPTSEADYLWSLLPQLSRDAIEDKGIGGDEFSPQWLAYQWMLEDPYIAEHSDERLTQRFALACLYFATGGEDNWILKENWLSYEHHECLWYNSYDCRCAKEEELERPRFLPCDANNKTYRKLSLIANDLVGTLPPELFLMAKLESIVIKGHRGLLGSIPTGLMSRAQSLEVLQLAGNALTGTIPTNLLELGQVHSFGFCCNQLSGTIPTQLGLFTSQIKRFSIDTNHLSGTIPTEIGRLSNVTDLRMGLNALSGTLPTELGLCSNLRLLLLSELLLTGSIPSEFGSLSGLWGVSMDKAHVTGTLPTEIGQWESLWFLNINNNPSLTGLLPTELGLWTRIENLELENNGLSGSIVSELGLLQSMQELRLDSNSFIGSIPTELGLMSSLLTLRLHDNLLTGKIPSELGLATGMEILELQRNMLTGEIAMDLVGIANTTLTFDVSQNSLSGVIPEPLCAIDSISFDCSEHLCGCEECRCMSGNQTN